MRSAPPIAFLGVSGRAARVRDPSTGLGILNALGIRSVIASPIYPMALNGWKYLFAIHDPRPEDQFDVVIRDSEGNQVGSTHVALFGASPGTRHETEPGERREYLPLAAGGWVLDVGSAEQAGFLVSGPGTYEFRVRDGATELPIGWLHFHLGEPLPLTLERIAAIKSDPDAAKLVRVELKCSKCHDKISTYTGFERSAAVEAGGHVWYQNLPDDFRCRCGHFSVDLKITRRNLFALLGTSTSLGEFNSPVRLYDHGSIQTIERDLAELLDSETREEDIQTFFEKHPLALHICSPAERLFSKAPILTNYFCDFAILTPSRELVLVELEKATTKLMTRRGGITSDLQHAFDQVQDWLRVADDHLLAFLDSLDIEKEQVALVRGIVIAGRDARYEDPHLRSLKGRDFGRVRLLTYDDVLASLRHLGARILESEKRPGTIPAERRQGPK